MVLPMFSASAVEESAARPTIEEILNGYHEKAFAAQTAEENGGASTYARSGSGSSQTLEQETVDELTAAGYEAYHVTGDNYEALEETLHTDFAEMGLDPNSSYVVVISGEESDNNPNSNPNSRVIDPPTYEDFDDGSDVGDGGGIGGSGGDNGDTSANVQFEYVYEGCTYIMRYVTVTSTGADALARYSEYTPQEANQATYFVQNLFSSILVGAADSISDKIPFGTLASLLFSSPDDHIYTEIAPNSFSIHATSFWSCIYIQVWDETAKCWTTAQLTEYVTSVAYCAGFTCNPDTGEPEPIVSEAKHIKTYSRLYFDEEQRKLEAMIAYGKGMVYPSTVDKVDFYVLTQDGEILFASEGDPLFSHTMSVHPIYPDSYEN